MECNCTGKKEEKNTFLTWNIQSYLLQILQNISHKEKSPISHISMPFFVYPFSRIAQ